MSDEIKNGNGNGNGENEENFSMNDINFEEMLDKSFKQFRDGNIVSGTVIEIEKDYVYIDIGYKSEGIVSCSEFRTYDKELNVKIGDTVEVFIEQLEVRGGLVRLSWEKAEKVKRWGEIEKTCDSNGTIKGVVVATVKGGFTVDLGGIKAFLPGSHADIKPVTDSKDFLGKTFEFQILKHNKARSNIVVSIRAVLEKEREEKKKDLLDSLKIGEVISGIVKNIVDFGIFIDLGGLDGMVHIGDVRWGRQPKDLNSIFKIGDEVQVKVMSIDKEKERAQLSIKHMLEDPWIDIEQKVPLNATVEGEVISVTDNGVRVEIIPGIEGFVPYEEISWSKTLKNPGQIVQVGEKIPVFVLEHRINKRELLLSIKQGKPNPWDLLTQLYAVGDNVTGKITGLIENGIFVEVVEGVEGLVRINDISWTEKISNIKKKYKRGQEIEVKILSIDKENGKLALGIKQLSDDPVKTYISQHKVGEILEGTITRVTEFGIFIELEKGVEALLRKMEADLEKGEELKNHFNEGDKITSIIIAMNENERKIALSIKRLRKQEEANEFQEFSKDSNEKMTLGDVIKKSLVTDDEEGE